MKNFPPRLYTLISRHLQLPLARNAHKYRVSRRNICKHLVWRHAGNLQQCFGFAPEEETFTGGGASRATSLCDISIEFRVSCVFHHPPVGITTTGIFSCPSSALPRALLSPCNYAKSFMRITPRCTRMLQLFWDSGPQMGVKEVSWAAPRRTASGYVFGLKRDRDL